MCGLVQTVTGSLSVCSSLHPYTFQRSEALWASDQKKGFLSVFPACFTTTVQLCGNKAINKEGGIPTKTSLPQHTQSWDCKGPLPRFLRKVAFLSELELLHYHTTLGAHTWGVAEREEGGDGKPFPMGPLPPQPTIRS